MFLPGRAMLRRHQGRSGKAVGALFVLSALACEGAPSPQGHEALAQASSALTSVPCAALGEAIIANSQDVTVDAGSVVDSYSSSLGAYGGSNVSSNATVQAAGSVVLNGGAIHGSQLAHSAAGLSVATVPANARALPFSSSTPGNVNINIAQDSITLTPGNYVVSNLNVNSPGAIRVFPAGLVTIYVTGNLNLGGDENPGGIPSNLQFVVTSAGTINVNSNGSLVGSIYAPSSVIHVNSRIFGSVAGSAVTLNSGGAVHFDQSSVCPQPPPTTPAGPPPHLPAPPPPVVGCYVNTANGWQPIPCAGDAFIDSHFGKPDIQTDIATTGAAPPLVFGQVAVTIPQLASENDTFLASTASISPLCQTSGTPVPNSFSIQNNTNKFAAPAGTIVDGADVSGHKSATQFTIQSNGSTSTICIWNVDVTTQDYSHRKCAPENPPQRALQNFDQGNIAGFVNSNGTLTAVAQFSWVQPGQPNQYAVVYPDTYGLGSSWNTVSGGMIGNGDCSQAQFTSATVVTQSLASTCAGDTEATSPICAPPVLQPNATAFLGSVGTAESNNLTATGPASLAFLNQDLAVSNVTATTSGSCLGSSHAYVKDNPNDFGATPSNLGGAVFWESPDIFLVTHGTPVDINGVSTETTITPGGQFDVWVRVHNEPGCASVTNVRTKVSLADPSALSVDWDAGAITGGNFVGNNMSATGVTVPAGGVALIGPLSFTAPTTGFGNGHRCILAAITADQEGPPANPTDAPDSNQVAQRNIQFVAPCDFPLTNATTAGGNLQLTLTVAPSTGTPPSLTGLPDIEMAFDDADQSWFNTWKNQSGNGTKFAVSHSTTTGKTTVRLGTFSVALDAVTLGAGQTRDATGTTNLPSNAPSITLQMAASLTETGPSGPVTIQNGGSCIGTAPVIGVPQ